MKRFPVLWDKFSKFLQFAQFLSGNIGPSRSIFCEFGQRNAKKVLQKQKSYAII